MKFKGRSGLGKSTFINTLFLAEINDLKEPDAPIPRGSTVRVEEKHVRLVENSVTLNLTLVDTPGFGDAVNNSKWYASPFFFFLKFSLAGSQ